MFVCFFIQRVTISSFYNICLIFNLKFGGLIPFRWEYFNNILSFFCTVSRKVNIKMCTIISLILEMECVHTNSLVSVTREHEILVDIHYCAHPWKLWYHEQHIFFSLGISINWFNRILPIVSIGATNFE